MLKEAERLGGYSGVWGRILGLVCGNWAAPWHLEQDPLELPSRWWVRQDFWNKEKGIVGLAEVHAHFHQYDRDQVGLLPIKADSNNRPLLKFRFPESGGDGRGTMAFGTHHIMSQSGVTRIRYTSKPPPHKTIPNFNLLITCFLTISIPWEYGMNTQNTHFLQSIEC